MDRIAAQVTTPFEPVVPDLEIATALAADVEQLTLPQPRQLRSARAGCGAQRDAILDHDRQGGGKGNDHCGSSVPPASGVAATGWAAARVPMRFEPMNCPAAGVGAMMTCTLSESLSARVFWMSSG